MTTDKGLRKAAGSQPTFKLPSNFTYRMMQEVNQYAYLHEKKLEKRTFQIIWIVAILLGIGTFTILGIHYKEPLITFLNDLPDGSTALFYLPICIAAFLLLGFNFWLQKYAKKKLLDK